MGLKMLDALSLPSYDFFEGLGEVDDLGGGTASVSRA
jgi:hypothetical protein